MLKRPKLMPDINICGAPSRTLLDQISMLSKNITLINKHQLFKSYLTMPIPNLSYFKGEKEYRVLEYLAPLTYTIMNNPNNRWSK
jgi:hypothetical protein